MCIITSHGIGLFLVALGMGLVVVMCCEKEKIDLFVSPFLFKGGLLHPGDYRSSAQSFPCKKGQCN